ncbi:hypothetical protein KAFR_0L00610 [Kazachstania africana CBS 2517]|uniref:Uncharacterized protein n=1 Tax=Kazachstania africana (strain ATCC 22294 / BCRC 22015 / CBS 2517 / CECT 1963 / NBRC 1671 / NRRL Y-8276) TaxID=1071382 RepID=H2B218_KAZAF|nr:hypothetical protein KAFR_0L00610 [Kazachstania africana CBS 2517]CCF60668.1 hypothetical protein KAFR_0L00610 [Kazachstania africana CBS 2517]
MDIEPTFKGYMEDENDALLILQAILNGKLRHIPRRPYEIERPYLIVSGNIFVFIEEISGIKRWTDGVSWSPSRISGKFLIYKELDKDNPSSSSSKKKSNSRIKLPPLVSPSPNQQNGNDHSSSAPQGILNSDINDPSVSTLRSVHPLKYTGLVKKTISITLKRLPYSYYENFHIVSYYTVEDVKQNRLITPKDSLFFRDVRPCPELITAMENATLGNSKGHSKTNSITPPISNADSMDMATMDSRNTQPHMNHYNNFNTSQNQSQSNNKFGLGNSRNSMIKNEDYSSTTGIQHGIINYPSQSSRYQVSQSALPSTNSSFTNSFVYANGNSFMNSDYVQQQQQQQQMPGSLQSSSTYPYYYSMPQSGTAPNTVSGGHGSNLFPSSYFSQNEQRSTSASTVPYNSGTYPVYPVSMNTYNGNTVNYNRNNGTVSGTTGDSNNSNNTSSSPSIPTPLSVTNKNSMLDGIATPVTHQGVSLASNQSHPLQQQYQYGSNSHSNFSNTGPNTYQYQTQYQPQYQHQNVSSSNPSSNIPYAYNNSSYGNSSTNTISGMLNMNSNNNNITGSNSSIHQNAANHSSSVSSSLNNTDSKIATLQSTPNAASAINLNNRRGTYNQV